MTEPNKAVSLTKGARISLAKVAPDLRHVHVGLGWDARGASGAPFDLDASAFLLSTGGQVRDERDFIFYNQLRSPEGSVEHTGDNLTGEGEGDDESLKVKLEEVPPEVERVVFAVTIHEAEARRQSFGQVRNAFIRLLDDETGAEVARYDLTEEASTETAMVFGSLYRHQGEWKFAAEGVPAEGGLDGLCRQYGVQTA
jgi:tellurium resistance protein TerD